MSFRSALLEVPSFLALISPAFAQEYSEQAELVLEHPTHGARFGVSVSISADTAVVGRQTFGGGPTYVFVRHGMTWTKQAELPPPVNHGYFGSSVAVAGDTAIVGAPYYQFGIVFGTEWGAAFLFVRSGEVWTAQGLIAESDPANLDHFGESVAVAGNTVVVGAPYHDTAAENDGAVYVFVRNGANWTQQAKLVANDPFERDHFGESVAISADTIVVGARYKNAPNGNDDGAAYVFTRSGTAWTQQAKLLASDRDLYDHFGTSVSISGETIAVGSPYDSHPFPFGNSAGSVYFFVRSGNTWVEQAKLIASDFDAGAFLGSSVSISGDTAIAGAPGDDIGGDEAGSVYVFRRTGTAWSQVDKLTASDAAEDAHFGHSASIFGGTILAGAPDADLGGVGETGSAYVYARPCVTLDFETEDDLATALGNGQHLDTEFGLLATVSSSGANAGLAIFDSTPGGPNDPSQDRDLLVGTGNILILQTENFPPDANDVFPRPNDDDDGGTISLAFASPTQPTSLRLIDVDAGDGPVTLILIDSAAKRRTYTVPSNWTGDRLASQPGQGMLDLSNLAPQQGFSSTATASQDSGFDPFSVIRLDVTLRGSGGLDNLEVCVPSLALASATVREGSGINPSVLRAASMPVIGRTWAANLDCRTYGSGLATLNVLTQPTAGTMTLFGEVLISGTRLHRTIQAFSGSVSVLAWNIPNDLALCGLAVHAQGLCQGAPTIGPKMLRAGGRLSNALDLVIGF
jgi:FG-GAP repeat protein